jgi:hypothetical protein
MPIILNRAVFEPEAIRIMSVVLESVCAELDLCDKDDSATRLVASKIIEFAQSGVLDAARLRSMTRKDRRALQRVLSRFAPETCGFLDQVGFSAMTCK